VGFFCGEPLEEAQVEAASFRALTKLSATKRDQAIASATFALAMNDWMEQRFAMPECDVPRISEADPETAAGAVRSAWELGEQPIPNMIHLLERHGVRVFSLLEECAAVDAFSFWRGDVPFVFLNTIKTAERSRMDAAHELGHLVLHWMHGQAPRGREAEGEAQDFGSAFLMPRSSVVANAPKTGMLGDIHKAKRYWKVAAANLTRRMYKVGLLSDWQYRRIFIELNTRGQRTTEPDGIQRETSQLLQKVLEVLRKEDGLSKADIADRLAIPLEELNKIVFGLVLTPVAGSEAASTDVRGPRPQLRIYTGHEAR
jgi:Zn-dependent peptidase ImmA (M78 family)